jgi:hypothetical protein
MAWAQRAGRAGMTAVAIVALGCGGDGPTGGAASIQITVNPATLSVQQGSSNSVTVTITRGGGYNGTVTLAVAGLPAGVTATTTPAQLSGTTISATIAVNVAATVAANTYTATVTGTGQGLGTVSATYQLIVTAAPNYALTVTPATLTIAAGGSSSTTVNIDRTNFTGGVAFSLLNPPAGITGAFNTTPSTTNSSQLVVNVAANVAPGSYSLTIQGNATGPGLKTTTLAIIVTAPPTPTNVEYRYCSIPEAPLFFAYQDGGGVWQVVNGTPSAGTIRFTFTIAQGRGGVLTVFRFTFPTPDPANVRRAASVRQKATSLYREKQRERFPVLARSRSDLNRSGRADIYVTTVVYASASELVQDGFDDCTPSAPTKTVTATIAGVPTGNFARLSLGNDATDVFIGGSAPATVTFTGVAGGVVDFVGTRTVPGQAPNRAIVFRNLNIPNGGSLPSVVDFNGPASSAPANALVTITGGTGDDLEAYTQLVTANGEALLWNDFDPTANATRPWGGLSAAALATGDFHGLVVFASPRNNSGDFRVSLRFLGQVSNQTIAFGPAVTVPTTSQIAMSAYPRLRFQGSLPTEYNKGVTIDVVKANDAGNAFSLIASSAYLSSVGNAFAYDFTMPDVSALAGFPAASRLTAGANDLIASGFGFLGTGIFDPPPALGLEFKASLRNSTVNVQ